MSHSSTPAIIELVDTEILAVGNGCDLFKTPGYALVEEQGIQTGDRARSQACLYPQRSFSQYWRQLTLAPLPGVHRYARHYADLAFAQLRDIHRQLNAPENLVFLLPGSFSKDQLSILLGLANALPATTTALVDVAVAAGRTLAYRGEVLHLDIQLHQAVVTRLHLDASASRKEVEIIPDAGLKAFYSAWAHYIADQFIEQYRYDPLHLAVDEQQLYDHLPGWLSAVEQNGQYTAELNVGQGNFRINLNRQGLQNRAMEMLKPVASALEKFSGSPPRIGSYRLGMLPGLPSALNIQLLDREQAVNGCRQALQFLANNGGNVPYVTELPLDTAAEKTGSAPVHTASSTSATHLLIGHRACPIGDGLGVGLSETGSIVTGNLHSDLWLSFNGNQLKASLRNNTAPIEIHGNPDDLKPGDTLKLGDKTLSLIEVDAEP